MMKTWQRQYRRDRGEKEADRGANVSTLADNACDESVVDVQNDKGFQGIRCSRRVFELFELEKRLPPAGVLDIVEWNR